MFMPCHQDNLIKNVILTLSISIEQKKTLEALSLIINQMVGIDMDLIFNII
jgi:hypothetical protein